MIDTQVQEPLSTKDLLNKNGPPPVPLFDTNEASDLHTRWEKIQISFVDEPRESVAQADQLVATVIQRLAEIFAAERNKLENEWAKGDSVTTEDHRNALRRYRSLFDRLLSV